MEFSEWFDPCNFNHLEAYRNLEKTGYWPENFIPKDIKGQQQYFAIEATAILCKAWLKYTLYTTPDYLNNLKMIIKDKEK